TRDSSTERGTSQEESNEENRASSSSPSRRNTPTSGVKARPPPGDPSAQHAPSAFRHVGDPSPRPGQSGDPIKDKKGATPPVTATDTAAVGASPPHHDTSRHDSPSSYSSPSRRHQGKQPGPGEHAPASYSPAHSYHHAHPHPAGDVRDHGAAPPPEPDVGGDSDSISGELNHPGEADHAPDEEELHAHNNHNQHPPVDANTIRLFIALFDYDPMTMSPNIDCVDEELPFREGQIIRVLGDKDSDGFYKGELAGRVGLVPCNMVSEVRIDDPELVEQLLQEAQGSGGTQIHPALLELVNSAGPAPHHREAPLTPNGAPPLPALAPMGRPGPRKRMVAMYDYDPQELSPNVDAE
ncbi:hypothetical protein EGW08_002445, partial [Elysia chlorotica]